MRYAQILYEAYPWDLVRIGLQLTCCREGNESGVKLSHLCCMNLQIEVNELDVSDFATIELIEVQ